MTRFVNHADHGLEPVHMDLVQEIAARHNEFFIETVTLPEGMPDLWSGIYGPIAGDAPIAESEVHYTVRGTRKGPSRLIAKPTRRTRRMTVIGGPGRNLEPNGEPEQIIYTAHGGEAAPREWWDPSMLGATEDIVTSFRFWRDHALSSEG